MKNKKVIFVSGLPRSGSTLTCQLLAHHPDIYSDGHSSPILHALQRTRTGLSNDDFLLSQMQTHYDLTYEKMLNAFRGFFYGWFADTDKKCIVDKNRAWLGMIDLAESIAPDCYFIVNIRELVQVFGSIEQQHKKTVLLNSVDGAADKTPSGRSAHYFNAGGLVHSCIANVQSAIIDIAPEQSKRIKFVQFERLMSYPQGIMNELYEWMGLPKHEFDPNNLTVHPEEADSFYRFKYLHKTRSSIQKPKEHWVPADIRNGIINANQWYYQNFYPEYLEQNEQQKQTQESTPEVLN